MKYLDKFIESENFYRNIYGLCVPIYLIMVFVVCYQKVQLEKAAGMIAELQSTQHPTHGCLQRDSVPEQFATSLLCGRLVKGTAWKNTPKTNWMHFR